MQQSVVSVRGQTVIPKEIREVLGIKPGTTLWWSVKDGVVTMKPAPKDPVAALRGVLKGKGSYEQFLADRNAERAREREMEERQERAWLTSF